MFARSPEPEDKQLWTKIENELLREGKMAQMDEIDQKQQTEITALQKRDILHDRELFWFKIVGLVIVLWTIVSTAIVMETLSTKSPYFCPHPDCIHHRHAQ